MNKRKNIIVINGPNLNLLGEREQDIYGQQTLPEINDWIRKCADEMNIAVKFFQSNHEGEIIDFIQEMRKWADGIVINPGALTHYSYALRDALSAVNVPAVEVHLSDITRREKFRKISVVKDVCVKQIFGLGPKGYLDALKYFTLNELH
ncbi:MAG: type II 3-dehydroquinate dehydratase [bacterium]